MRKSFYTILGSIILNRGGEVEIFIFNHPAMWHVHFEISITVVGVDCRFEGFKTVIHVHLVFRVM